MMDEKKYKQLMNKLNSAENMFLAHVTNSYRGNTPDELITPEMDVETLSKDKAAMVHSMLHLFYQNKNGKGLTIKTIESLHSKVSKKLGKHSKFDGLDIK